MKFHLAPVLTILVTALSSGTAKANPAMNSQLTVSCLDTIRDRYFPIGSNFDSCANEPTSSGRLDCLRRNSQPLPEVNRCSSVPQGNPTTANVNGVSVDLPSVMSAQEACGAIADPNTRKACEQDTYGRAFPATEVNICRTIPDNNQILKCLMAIQGGCFGLNRLRRWRHDTFITTAGSELVPDISKRRVRTSPTLA